MLALEETKGVTTHEHTTVTGIILVGNYADVDGDRRDKSLDYKRM